MIQKNLIFKPADTTGIELANVFHVYKGSKGRFAFSGDFVKSSVLKIIPDRPTKKKSKHVCMVVRSKFKNSRSDRFFVNFSDTTCVFLKKKLSPRGSYFKGPGSLSINRKKFLLSFRRKI